MTIYDIANHEDRNWRWFKRSSDKDVKYRFGGGGGIYRLHIPAGHTKTDYDLTLNDLAADDWEYVV